MTLKRFVILVIILVIFAEFRFLYLPGKRKVQALERLIAEKISEKDTLEELCLEYESITKDEKGSELRITEDDFSLFSYTGSLIERHKMVKSVSGIQPLATTATEDFTIERIRVGLKGVTLKELYDFLNEIEAESTVYTPEFRMRREKETPHLLSAETELIAIKRVTK